MTARGKKPKIKQTECPSISARAAKREWGASRPTKIAPHEFIARLNWMGGPALAFRDFCEVCDEHRNHPIHKGAP